MANEIAPWEREDDPTTVAPWDRQGSVDKPGPVLAEWYEQPTETGDKPKYLGELPQQTLGHVETEPKSGRKVYVEGKGQTRAVFTDQPQAGESGRVSAQALANAEEDTARKGKQAVVGGALQGATFGFADELAAAATRSGNLISGETAEAGKTYAQLRDENRGAFKDAEKGSPGEFTKGQLIGGATTMLAPGIGQAGAGRPLLSARNVALGTGLGALQAAGESEADLTKEQYGAFAKDVTKGGAAGGTVTAGLGLAGKGIGAARTWLATAPERQATRADDALWNLMTYGAPKNKREELAGIIGSERAAVLDTARSNPAFMEALKRGDKAAAAEMVLAAQPEVAARKAAAIASMESKTGKRLSGQPIIAEMERQRDALRSVPTPENMAAAEKWQKRIDAVNEAWMPPPKAPELKGEALASRLTADSDSGTRQRAAMNAEEFGKVAEKYKLGKDAENLPERQKKIADTLETLNKKTAEIYEKPKSDVFVANITDKMREWADELRKQPGGVRLRDADNIDGMAANISQAAANGDRTTMTAKELRQFITNLQGKAFSGSYLDPNEAKAMQRELSSRLRGILDEHVAKNGSPADVKKLGVLNKQISALIAFQESAEREAVKAFEGLHKAAPVAAQDTRTGRATVKQLYDLIQATDDPEAKRVLTGELYKRIGPDEAKRLTGIEREESLLGKLGETTKAGAEQYAGDTERGKRLGKLFDRNNPIASIVAKYGDSIADKANAFAVRAEKLRRLGASDKTLGMVGKAMGLAEEVSQDVIRVLAPKSAASAAVGGGQ